MQNLQRLRELQPWQNVSEEDLFFANGLYLQVRGNLRRPNGLWCTPHREHARLWVLEPQKAPAPEDWRLDADSGALVEGTIGTAAVEKVLDLVLDQFEGKSVVGLEFPVAFND
ncbi:hypothetical protein IV102_18125 [bacterium]|nr:hypothetical protein [bacterium]